MLSAALRLSFVKLPAQNAISQSQTHDFLLLAEFGLGEIDHRFQGLQRGTHLHRYQKRLLASGSRRLGRDRPCLGFLRDFAHQRLQYWLKSSLTKFE